MSDVKTKNLTATAAAGVEGGRTRVKAVYWVAGAATGSISFKDGGAGGVERIKIDTPAGVTLTDTFDLPGEGVLFYADPYVTLTNVTSVTFAYG